MREFAIPEYVLTVLRALESAGYTAVLVGGCVRDMVMGIPPHDWDVATSALSVQIADIFPDSFIKNEKYGVVSIHTGKCAIDISTFRRESEYRDGRHPDSVEFVGDIRADLSRRDFTVNTLYMNSEGCVTDVYGALDDIKKRLIRAVGDPGTRFDEDALRMLRAFRFSAQLGFDIEIRTLEAIYRHAGKAHGLSAERVRVETEKMLMSDRPERICNAASAGLYTGRVPGLGDITGELVGIGRMEKDRQQRWSALCGILKNRGAIRSADDFLRSFRLESRLIKRCAAACDAAQIPFPDTPGTLKRLLSKYDVDTAVCICAAADVIHGGVRLEKLRRVIDSGEPCRISDLALRADDLMELGFAAGETLGRTLERMLENIIDHPENNSFEALREYALTIKGRL